MFEYYGELFRPASRKTLETEILDFPS